ncbi:chaperone NapD [Marinimicrobium alkaliphilum]|uniref:chaperone NapD n=1 Tax=Marinimicrobium alkaliphilum TaxID=2202654 RepID=UPI0018E0BACD|nr:chaperone NapD [Marinimicrobium alkaliphilum]
MMPTRIATAEIDPHSMHVASYVVHVRPEAFEDTKTWLLARPATEIHAQDPAGKLVVVMECADPQAILDAIDQTGERPGVISAALVYHEILDEEL